MVAFNEGRDGIRGPQSQLRNARDHLVHVAPRILRHAQRVGVLEHREVLARAPAAEALRVAVRLLGMREPDDEFLAYYERMRDMVEGMPTVAFVLAAEDMPFGDIVVKPQE